MAVDITGVTARLARVPVDAVTLSPIDYDWGSPATAGLWHASAAGPDGGEAVCQAAATPAPLARSRPRARGAPPRLVRRLLPVALRARHDAVGDRRGAATRYADAHPAPSRGLRR